MEEYINLKYIYQYSTILKLSANIKKPQNKSSNYELILGFIFGYGWPLRSKHGFEQRETSNS